jgi:putative transposase
MPRVARIVVKDYPHHIVQRGNNRQNVFFDDQDKEYYLELLKKYSKECSSCIKAYCLMTNHIHILMVPRQDNSLAKTMQKVSLRYTQYINKKFKRTGRLWECRFHSAIVDTEPYLWTVCRYIERNPVRAKMVEKPGDYVWSSARFQISNRKSDFLEPVWKDAVDREEYKKFLNIPGEKEENEMVKKRTFEGKPIGSESFTKKLAEMLGIVINTRPKGRPRKNKK